MSVLLQNRFAAVVLLGALYCITALADSSRKIEVSLSSPGHCYVENKQLQCAAVARYLRNDLKLPLDTEITVTWTFYKDQHKYANKVADQLKHAGYRKLWCIGFEEDPIS